MHRDADQIPNLFGSYVFNEEAMTHYVDAAAMDAWRSCLQNGQPLALEVADAIAARGTGKVGKGKAVRSRREEVRIIIKAGPALPEFVSSFHRRLLAQEIRVKNKDAPKSASSFFK